MTVRPGYGSPMLHLRQPSSKLLTEFGEPQRKVSVTALRQYWFYPEQHFECLVSKRTGAVLSIFLHRGNPVGGNDLFHLTETEIRMLLASPVAEGGGFEVEAGYVPRWLSYSDGIGFYLDQTGKVETVSLYARKRTARTRKASESAHVRNQSLGIATLRTW